MLCDIIKAEYIEGYKLRVFFENGESGIVVTIYAFGELELLRNGG